MKESRYIVDTTLRDGEQSPGVAFSKQDKIEIAKLLDAAQVYQIEAGIPAMGGIEKETIIEIKALCKNSLISTWNRINKQDIRHSFDCQPDIIHISVPVSDAQIYEKLQKDKIWLKENMRACVDFARAHGYQVTVGFEDASRADLNFLLELAGCLKSYEVLYLRFADTVGILTPFRTAEKVKAIIETTGINIEFHAHNDLGMAVANSIAAAKAGAKFIDTTLGGIGERTGNCDFVKFIYTAQQLYDLSMDLASASVAAESVTNKLKVQNDM
ncbi:beta/alpha barrel domain-containing protein [Anaerosinus massiliensis]|uniref:homocitrate synthase n=1 Tax=Massilibacillus massiliensis TaxID=1806837 RepID=UPI000A573485|nr:homocitrate synthase [Massilibacillus massiliensis]